MKDDTRSFASESGHYYTADGTPAYEVIGKNGKPRATTIRDAKASRLFPSVTTVMRLMDKPGLNNWLIDQHILAALTLPRNDGEPEAEWMKRVKQDAREQGRKAAERGTEIHGDIERQYKGEGVCKYPQHTFAAIEAVNTNCPGGQWHAEKSATSTEYGYGCKTDLICHGWTLDFKTKEFGPDDDLRTWDEHHMQLAANSIAHGKSLNRAAIVYVSVSHPGLARFLEVERAELDRGFAMFMALLALWRAKHGYDPRR